MIGLVVNEQRVVDLKAKDKKTAICELVGLMAQGGYIQRPDEACKALLEREKILSTGIGLEIAVPHARLETVDKIIMAMGRQKAGIPFDAIDGKPVKLLFLIVGPEAAQRQYLKLLARIVQVIKKSRLREKLLKAADAKEMYSILKLY
ncbi:MAG: PTS sugar transporter subunit IIA [Candidatus Omnitrophica bacterium]|nr:PTS sugar transporter subunit IIA [Candidatus Omnitrophota bacterium]